MKKIFFAVMLLFSVNSYVNAQAIVVGDTLIFAKPPKKKTVKFEPINTGKYVLLSKERGPELVYRGNKKKENTGHYSYFVIRMGNDNVPARIYLSKERVEEFTVKFGE